MNNYITPFIRRYNSYKELLDERSLYGAYPYFDRKKFPFKELFVIKRSLIISEPGYGKTRLLKEIVVQSENYLRKAIFIDLKKVDKDLESFINDKIPYADDLNCLKSEEALQNATFLKTSGFALKDSEDIVICLDALDEVKQQYFSKAIDWIKELSRKYTKISLLISCRWHHLKKHYNLFVETSFIYLEIGPFSINQTKEYLKQHNISEENTKKIIDALEFKDRQLIIQIPRYLQMLTTLANEKGIDYVLALKKSDLFEHFIYKKLEKENETQASKKNEMIKRVLEKLALIMEIYQINELSKEELMTFFDDIKSSLTISFFQQIPIEDLYDRTVIKDNIDSIEFENTEFQEYLAAKEILRLGRPDQVVFDLAVDQELREIFPSWFNTLGFLVDLEISLLKPILDFGVLGSGSIKDEEYHRFLTKVDVNRLPTEERKLIFKEVFEYYQAVLHWIDYDIAENLSYYFDVSQIDLLKESIDSKKSTGTARFVRRGNVADIIAFLIERNVLQGKEKDYWKKQLVEFTKEDNSALQRGALLALSKFKDISLIKKVSSLFNKYDELIDQTFLLACLYVNPNDEFSIKCFVEGTKRDRPYAQSSLYKVKEKKAIQKLLDYFNKDWEFLYKFIDRESIYSDKDHHILLQNIEIVWDENIKKELEKIIVALFSRKGWLAQRSNFVKGIALLLKEKIPNYIFDFVSLTSKSPDLQDKLYVFEDIFSILLEKPQLEEFIQKLKTLKGKGVAYRTLQRIKFSEKKDAEEIYEEGRKYLKEEYEATEKYWEEQSQKQKPDKEERLYKEFKFRLKPEEGMYLENVFRFYLENREELKSFISKEDKTRLKELVELIFKKFDPGKQTLTITKKGEHGTSYTVHSWIPIFGDCLMIATELGIDVSKYRQKIISYIPFASDAYLSAIFSLVSNPTIQEMTSLLDVYTKKRNDDLIVFKPSNFIEISNRYKVAEAIPILKKFVENNNFVIYERISALNAIANTKPNETYFKSIFRRYSDNKNESYHLAVKANEYLITKHLNEQAIKWRFKQLKERAFLFVSPKVPHSVSTQESELRDKEFASSIMNLKDPKYKGLFLDLLDESFNIYNRGEEYSSYATYLWQIVASYFYNLIELKSYSHLKQLENYLVKYSSQGGLNWFKYELRKLKRSYITYIGKPQNVANCIKAYNRIKENQYLDIATPKDLVEIIKKVINDDIKRWVESEGAYKFIQKVGRVQEDLIQKTIKTQFENGLLRGRLRPNEINIRREEQLLDDKRTDFLISYGFIGPILIEIKRVDNEEVTKNKKRKEYRDKLLQYVIGTKSHSGIFLLFQINNKYSLDEYLPKVTETYKDCTNIEVIGLNCILY